MFFSFVIIFCFPRILFHLFIKLPLVFFYCLRQLQLFTFLVNIFPCVKLLFKNDKTITQFQTVLLVFADDINVRIFQCSNNALVQTLHFDYTSFHITKKSQDNAEMVVTYLLRYSMLR